MTRLAEDAQELPRTDNNAILHLLSASPEQVRYGVEHYEQHSPDTSTLLNQLFQGYKREGLAMPYTMQDFRRDYAKEHLKDLTYEERLEGVPLEERLHGVPPKEIEKYLQRRKKPGSPKRKNQKK